MNSTFTVTQLSETEFDILCQETKHDAHLRRESDGHWHLDVFDSCIPPSNPAHLESTFWSPQIGGKPDWNSILDHLAGL